MKSPPIFLVTRPLPQARNTAKKLKNIGILAYLEPCFRIKFLKPDNLPLLKNNSIIIITSLNGAKAFSKISNDHNLRVVTVGCRAAEFLKKNGFLQVNNAGKNIDELLHYVKSNFTPQKNKFFYIRGEKVAKDLRYKLGSASVCRHRPNFAKQNYRAIQGKSGFPYSFRTENSGNDAVKLKMTHDHKLGDFDIKDIILYKTPEKKSLSPEVVKLIKQGKISGILFYSTHTAKIFHNLVEKAGIAIFLDKPEIFCLSRNIAKACEKFSNRKIKIAAEPSEDSLFKLIEKYANKRR